MTLDPALLARLERYVPRGLIAQFPDPKALTAAIRRLNRLHQALASFLPQYIAENETLYTQEYADLRAGTFLFADVSGFTALSEKLQREGGREGTEILTRVINDFFAQMLEILAKSDGQLLKFAGDALEAFFPAPRRGNEAPLAIRTGLRMQREMVARFQPIQHPELERLFGAHDLALTMSIGICQGQLFEAVVGNEIQRDYVIQGDLPGQAMAAEEAGARDDVIVTAELQAAHADQFECVPVGRGFYRVIDNFGDQLSDYEFVVPRRRRPQTVALFNLDEAALLADLARLLERVEGVARFVAREVVDRLVAGNGHIEPENRPATVIFTHFTGFADLLADWGNEQLPLVVSLLGRYYNLMHRAIAANGGSLTRTDPYQRGVKMLITFGAPVAHPDDPERAVMTALEMNRQLANFNARLQDELPEALRRDVYVSQRIGITHGLVYAGEVGWKSRREYTVMGDDVNLAARLMSKGHMGQILLSERVQERVHPHFETEALPPMQMKGKSAPVQAFLVHTSAGAALGLSPTSDTPFVGRDLQLLSLTYALQQAKRPRRRQAFALIGEAGVGKTRIAKQVAQEAEQTGFQVAWATCQFHYAEERSVWATLLFQLLQLAQAKSEQAQRKLLSARLRELQVAELEPALSVMLFGSYHEAQHVLAKNDAAASSPATTPNVFDLAQVEDAAQTSGIWGIARDQIQAALSSASAGAQNSPSLWQTVQQRVGLADCVVQFLRAYTERTPALLVVDDLHRADTLTREVLAHVLAELPRAHLMILAAYEPGQPLRLNIRRTVKLADLDADETARLAERFLGVETLGEKLRALIWERTHGRPLFIESLLDLLDAQGQIVCKGKRAELHPAADTTALPDNVRTLIMSQVDRLSSDARALLQMAAVLGGQFPARALSALWAPNDTERIGALLDELAQHKLIEQVTEGIYRFRHGVAHTTVYESLNRLQRLNLHRAAAEWLQKQPDADRQVVRIAHHWVQGELPTRGANALAQAAEEAEAKGQIDHAIALYLHALEILPHDEGLRAHLERLQHAHQTP